MLIADIYLWWFTSGWKNTAQSCFSSLGRTLSFFSIGSLLRTLFAPYRQISAEGSVGTTRLAAFGDRLVSRLVGATVRLFLMLAGLAIFITCAIVFIALIIVWPLVPLLPVAGIALAVSGVTLW